MKDVQNMPDDRNIAIDKVGIKDLKIPVVIQDRANGRQHTVADVNFYVDLPHNFKGTHMSRFVEILNEYQDSFEISRLDEILKTARRRLHAQKAHIELTFPYFVKKYAPVSGAAATIDYVCTIAACSNGNEKTDIELTVRVPVTSLCPCSKEISAFGAHNQRSIVTLTVRINSFIWLEELIRIVEEQASCELYGLLKRPDEKFVTERAYDNPKFVEDMVRDVAGALNRENRIDAYVVESENFESIHKHSAYASIERTTG